MSDDIKKPWINATLKEIDNLINEKTFLVKDPEKDESMTPCMDVYKSKIQYDGSLDKLNFRIVVRGDLQKKELVGGTWSSTASMRNLKYLLEDATKHKARVHQLYFIKAFLQSKVKNRVFVKLYSRYTDYFPGYSKYFGRALRLLKSMYGMNNSRNLFYDELTEWLLETGFIPSQCRMSIYYKYSPYG